MPKQDDQTGPLISSPELLAHLASIRSRGMMEDFWIDYAFSTFFVFLRVLQKEPEKGAQWRKAFRKLRDKINTYLGEEDD